MKMFRMTTTEQGGLSYFIRATTAGVWERYHFGKAAWVPDRFAEPDALYTGDYERCEPADLDAAVAAYEAGRTPIIHP